FSSRYALFSCYSFASHLPLPPFPPRRSSDLVATAAGERIDTPVVVNAAGLWSPAVARLAGVDLPIIIGRHPVFVVERDAGFGRPHLVYLDLAGGSYARPETGGLTLTGSLTEDETRHPMEPEL